MGQTMAAPPGCLTHKTGLGTKGDIFFKIWFLFHPYIPATTWWYDWLGNMCHAIFQFGFFYTSKILPFQAKEEASPRCHTFLCNKLWQLAIIILLTTIKITNKLLFQFLHYLRSIFTKKQWYTNHLKTKCGTSVIPRKLHGKSTNPRKLYYLPKFSKSKDQLREESNNTYWTSEGLNWHLSWRGIFQVHGIQKTLKSDYSTHDLQTRL